MKAYHCAVSAVSMGFVMALVHVFFRMGTEKAAVWEIIAGVLISTLIFSVIAFLVFYFADLRLWGRHQDRE